MTRDYLGIELRVYSKPVGEGLTIEVKILTLLKSLFQAKTFCLSKPYIEGDSAVVISWV